MFSVIVSKGLQPPQRKIEFEEDVLLGEDDGVCVLTPAPAQNVVLATSFEKTKIGEVLPASFDRNACKNEESMYLYVIPGEVLKYAQERCPKGKTLARKEVCHTNLTGGAKAYCGGELCFIDESSVFYNGLSGRYPPRDSEELFAVGDIFKAYGYNATCLEWDFGTDTARVIVRRDLVKKI